MPSFLALFYILIVVVFISIFFIVSFSGKRQCFTMQAFNQYSRRSTWLQAFLHSNFAIFLNKSLSCNQRQDLGAKQIILLRNIGKKHIERTSNHGVWHYRNAYDFWSLFGLIQD